MTQTGRHSLLPFSSIMYVFLCLLSVYPSLSDILLLHQSISLVVFLDFLYLLYSNAFIGSWSAVIRVTCPNHVSRLLFILSVKVSFWCSLFWITSFHILSFLVFPIILFCLDISADNIFLSYSFRRLQHSDPYISTGTTNASYSLIFVVCEMFFALHNLLNFPNIAAASPVHLMMSILHFLSSVSRLPRYTNSLTCSISVFSILILIVIMYPSKHHWLCFLCNGTINQYQNQSVCQYL